MSQQPPPGPPNPPGPGWGGPQQGPPPAQGPGQPPGPYGPPGPPPGQYGPPPGQYGPPPGGGRSKGLVIGLVIAVLVVVGGGAAAAILLLGGDDNEPSSDDPLASAQAFVDAWKDADCDALENLMTDDFRKGATGECQADEVTGEPSDPEITEASGDSATAVISVGKTELELTLVKEDDTWLIDGIGGSVSSEIPPPSSESGGTAMPAPGRSTDIQEFADTFVAALRAEDCATLESMVSESFKASNECEGGDWKVAQMERTTA
jgi:hypothetical protein